MSQTETILLMVKKYSLGKIIGENSAGTDGDITYINLINGGQAHFTCGMILNNDGSHFYSTGIPPDIFLGNQNISTKKEGDPVRSKALKFFESSITKRIPSDSSEIDVDKHHIKDVK